MTLAAAYRRLTALEDARALLEREGLSCSKVISVDRDSILYLNGVEKPRTCWLHVLESGNVRLEMHTGFQAEPPGGWHDVQPGDRTHTITPV